MCWVNIILARSSIDTPAEIVIGRHSASFLFNAMKTIMK